jgi:hypothetical protein
LLLTPRRQCVATVTREDHLVISHDGVEVARLIPGEDPAEHSETWLDETCASFGALGPTLEMTNATYEEVFASIDIGFGAVPWLALDRGFAIDLPVGVAVEARPELALRRMGTHDEQITFEVVDIAERVDAGPDEEVIAQSRFSTTGPDGIYREIEMTELASMRAGIPWRTAILRVPFHDDAMFVKAEACAADRGQMFAMATYVAATLSPLA